MTVEAVVRACKTYGQITEVGKQVRKLLRKLREWFDNHVDSISEAYLTTRDSGLLFLVVQEDKAFNPSLEDALTDLDLEVANDQENFNLIRLSVLSLPATSEESVRFFLPPFEAE
jgi:hypothetical protein